MNAPVKAGHIARAIDLRDAGEVRRIEGFVAEARASLFHRPAWLAGVAAGTGQRAAGLVAESMGVITGWLPLTEVRSPLFGKALVSSGFGVGGGICASIDGAERLTPYERQALVDSLALAFEGIGAIACSAEPDPVDNRLRRPALAAAKRRTASSRKAVRHD